MSDEFLGQEVALTWCYNKKFTVTDFQPSLVTLRGSLKKKINTSELSWRITVEEINPFYQIIK